MSSVETDADGYTKALSKRQVQMIAIGGAIGVGLFLGAGGRLATAGPSLILSYAVCGLAAFFVMRALGELVLHRPVSGSFVEYAREFIGPWAGFTSGWMYWLNWAMTGIAEITAVAIYMHKWFPDLPQWITALVALVVLIAINMLSVKLFGELEFWFSVIKVTAIVAFLVVGTGLVIGDADIGGTTASVSNTLGHGGLFPAGFGVALMTLQAVIFAYAAIELVGIAAGETKDPEKIMPRAINGVVYRIAIFYVGSVLLLTMLLPWHHFTGTESPFVTVFSALGIPAVGDIMNAVVLTAALSSCNSGLYSTGRILRSLAQKGEAPAFTGRMNSRHVPVRRHPLHRCRVPGRRGAELPGAQGGVRHRDRHRVVGCGVHLGHSDHLPDAVAEEGFARGGRAAFVPDARCAVHLVGHVGVPRAGDRADGVLR